MIDKIFLHRAQIDKIGQNKAIEIDIRFYENSLVVTHDPGNGVPFIDFMKKLSSDVDIIINSKESGIEEKIIDIMKKFSNKYYFLDSQIPDIIRISKSNPEISNKFILRISEYEIITTKLMNLVKPEYVWLDYSDWNNLKPYDELLYIALTHQEQKVILVSPELYGESQELTKIIVEKVNKVMKPINLSICTDLPSFWRN